MPEMNPLSRRAFLLGASALTLGTARAASEPAAPGTLAPMPDRNASLLELTATQAVRQLAHGDISAERYAQALLARCAARRDLNAFITLEPERVLEAARAADRHRASGATLGPMHGLPIPVKDSVNTRDYPTTGGTPALREFRPKDDAPLVAALRGAGAIVLGKTNLHELSYGWTSNNLAFGAVRNPYDSTRIPGGSSGGTAAAVAARMAPLGVAEDTEGSIRVPAALCGIAGFRPTTGRYPTQGAVPISALFDQIGPHARSVADLALFDQVAAADPRPVGSRPLRGVRLAVARDYFFAGLDTEVERLCEAAIEKLRVAGAEIVNAPLPDLEALIDLITDQVQNHDVRVDLPKYLAEYHAGVTFDEVVARASGDIRAVFGRYVLPGAPEAVSDEVYRAAVDVHLPRLRKLYRDYFARTGASAIVFPATMIAAPRIGEERTVQIRGEAIAFDLAISRNIAPGSTAGLPGLVLPAGLAAGGLPVAIELDGPAGSDRELLALGLAVEAALGPLPAPRMR